VGPLHRPQTPNPKPQGPKSQVDKLLWDLSIASQGDAALQAKLDDIAGDTNAHQKKGAFIRKVVSVSAMHWQNAHEHSGEAYRQVRGVGLEGLG
jgi:hypothetical protein